MEKFGIFDLLDALSALTAHENDLSTKNTEPQRGNEKTEKTYSADPAETIRPDQNDRVYQPPVFGARTERVQSESAEGAKQNTAKDKTPKEATAQKSEPAPASADAFSSLMHRHDSLSKKIDRDNSER